MKSNKKFGSFGAKGYYIALILCAAAIGISGYLYYQNTTEDQPQVQNPTIQPGDATPDGGNIPVGGTEPDDDQLNHPQPTDKPEKQPLKTGAPLDGKTICIYSMECLAYNETTRDWRTHDGIDIAAEAGTSVCAAAAGVVYTTYQDDAMGMTVVIQHEDGYVSVYSSLAEELLVSPGDAVTLGQPIGTVGNTALLESAIGDHLHFSVIRNGKNIDPQDFLKMK